MIVEKILEMLSTLSYSQAQQILLTALRLLETRRKPIQPKVEPTPVSVMRKFLGGVKHE